jgi:hypothetical protein
MAQNANLKIDIPGVDFEQMAREAIACKLNEALLGADDVVTKIVTAALTQKVNDKGVVGSSYENKIAYVEWLAHDMIRQATLEVMKAKAEEMKPALAKAIEAELKRGIKTTAKALTDAFATQASCGWAVKVDVKPYER